MKTRTWKAGKFRVVERSSTNPPKEGFTSYDLQYKQHHIWTTLRTGLSKAELKSEFNIDIGD